MLGSLVAFGPFRVQTLLGSNPNEVQINVPPGRPCMLARLSFAVSTGIIKEKARVVAMDLRGHGKSVTDNDVDLSVETMCNDVLAVIKELYGDSPPAIILVGHRLNAQNLQFCC
ncbi:protein phosphatase methylesterase 1-like [Trifolium pratense]|uniref:Protein phosphatase methylesterase 1-like n=1 Tax=Trifolium pratense TaxID=57577 RepID=A0A2K3L0Z5_TRIPR|nr:protein phosphatase methylesterase 1-like [Trifolium pratense]